MYELVREQTDTQAKAAKLAALSNGQPVEGRETAKDRRAPSPGAPYEAPSYNKGAAALAPEGARAGAQVGAAPKAGAEVTRAEFLRLLHPEGPADPVSMMDMGKSLGLVKQGGEAGRPNDPITRAESAVVLARFAGILGSAAAGNTYFFADVFQGTWYFQAAHDARLFGIFRGTGMNQFLPQGHLNAMTAEVLVQRAKSAARVPLEEQSKGLKVKALTKPADVDALLANERLTPAQIRQARKMIKELPPSMRASRYEELSKKSTYRNQRNNAGKYAIADYMCNVTSLSMALNALGVDNPDETRQMEDVLDEELVRAGGSRYTEAGQNKLAKMHGMHGERQLYRGARTPGGASKWFHEVVLPRLQQGDAATMSIRAYGPGHIVRLQWVEGEGLRVDDPFGNVRIRAGGRFNGYNTNARNTEQGKGEDNLWPWDFVAREIKYVHFFS